MTPHDPRATALAFAFSSRIVNELDTDEIAAARRSNACADLHGGRPVHGGGCRDEGTRPGGAGRRECATHDYTDPVSLMADAFRATLGRPADPASSADAALTRAAWAEARAAGFDCDLLTCSCRPCRRRLEESRGSLP